ncbi:ATP-binding protein [Humitalea sp. 24SJ18S-53]|uniref:ATP-binding protein n=1 Tax=Humitalea sp. 24SJ18S-53 TaxID=3422307 RepID=UPI003D679D22
MTQSAQRHSQRFIPRIGVLPRPAPAFVPVHAMPAPSPLPFQLLRHHTKNALQRILAEIGQADTRLMTREAGRVLRDIERRIRLSASLSDALFGFTRAPPPMAERLLSLCEATVGLMGDPDQILAIDCAVSGACPATLAETVLRAAHEMVGNAVKHGLHARLVGRITIRLDSDAARTRLCVEDDGWGFAGKSGRGEGLGLIRSLAGQHGGTCAMPPIPQGTRVEMHLPHPDPTP